MCVQQNAVDLALEYPQAAKAVEESFYVDDCLTGADTIRDAVELQKQLQELFTKGGFLFRKWRSSEPNVLKDLPDDLKDQHDLVYCTVTTSRARSRARYCCYTHQRTSLAVRNLFCMVYTNIDAPQS